MTIQAAPESVIAALLQEGKVTSHGDFTLDMVKARDKLRQFQLLSPHLFILELVGAAVSGQASSIDVKTELNRLTFGMNEVQPYSKTELAQLHANLFLPQEDPRMDRLRQLAIALNSGLGLMPRLMELQSQHPRGMVQLKLTPTSENLARTSQTDGALRTTLSMLDEPGLLGFRRLIPRLDEEIALLNGRCRHAPIPIRVNGQPINKPVRLEPALAQVSCVRAGVSATLALASSLPVGLRPYLDEKERYGSLVWITGQTFGVPLDESQIIFMVNGVMLTDKRVSLVSGLPIKVLCTAPGLLKHASQSDIVENDRYQAVLTTLRNMVPDLMDELKKTTAQVEAILADPKEWPREGGSNFRRYLGGELELARSYLKVWAEAGWEAQAEKEALPIPPPPTPTVDRERTREWLAHAEVETFFGHGWMALPPAGRAHEPFTVRWEGHDVRLTLPFLPTRLCGTLQLSADLRAADREADRARIVSAVTAAVEQVLADLSSDVLVFPPPSQALARADILEYVLLEQKTLSGLLKVPPFSLLGRLVGTPIFRSTEGTSHSLRELVEIYQQNKTIFYTTQVMSGRSLDPTRKVFCLSADDVQRLSKDDLFKFTEYSQDLEEEERARQLQRERGMVEPRLDANAVLANARWRVDTAEICLALSRPYRPSHRLPCYKRGVLIEELDWGLVPCTGYLRDDRMAVDDGWNHVRLGSIETQWGPVESKLQHELHAKIKALYDSIQAALTHLSPTHPDYVTCCRYVLDWWCVHRESLLACGGPSVDPTIFVTRHGRRIGLTAVIRRFRERGRVEFIDAGELQLVVPDGVLVVLSDQPWMSMFLRAFFGDENVHAWVPAETSSATVLKLPPLLEGRAGDVLAGLFQQLGLPWRVREQSDPGLMRQQDTLGYWERDVLYLNPEHKLVRDVKKRGSRDRARWLHLLLAVLSARDAEREGEAILQLRIVQAVLAGLSSSAAAQPPPARGWLDWIRK